MARIPVVAGNWKMYKTPAEGDAFVRALTARLGTVEHRGGRRRPAVHRSGRSCERVAGHRHRRSSPECLLGGAGSVHRRVAPGMLAALGVRWVIIGHSERRQLFGETDQGVARKVRAVLDSGLRPIVCVGETEEEREAGLTEERLASQVAKGLAEVRTAEAPGSFWPTSRSGPSAPARPPLSDMAQDAIGFIRARVAEAFGGEAAAVVRILYGGSVKPDNIGDLMARPDIDGALVGGASLDVDSFAAIVESSP